MSNLTIKTSDNFELAVIYNNVPQSSRVVIFAHGMTVDKGDEGIFVRAEKLLNEGEISTVRFDFRAHGKSQGKSLDDFTISGELADLDSIVQFARKEGYEWIGLAGASFGGSIAALYAGTHLEDIHALVLANPVLDYEKAFLEPTTPWAKKVFKDAVESIKKDGFIKIGSRNFKIGVKLFEEMKNFFPYKELGKYKRPLLVVHGTKDSKVSFQDARKVFTTLSNPYKQFEAIKKSEHGFHEEPYETAVTDLIAIFFKEKSRSFYTKHIRDNCIVSASDFVKSAKELQKANLPHIQYHLASLALEEIGKAELVLMQHAVDDQSATNFKSSSMEDHERKLFWAFWGPNFGKHLMTQEELNTYKGLAKVVHWTRLNSLYTDTESIKLARDNVSQEEADRLTSLANARLEMEKNREFEFDKEDPDKEDPDKEVLKWFLDATKDPVKRPLIFGGKSHKKLVELKGNARDWIKWLKKQFDENDEEIREIIDEELSRKEPKGKERKEPKYKVKVKLYSDSHSIRKKVLNEWNEKIDFIQLDADDKRTLYCTFTHTKIMPIQALWEFGWGIARTFAIAINIATKGFFWWNVQKDIEKYYEEIWDLEKNMKLDVRPSKKLALNWNELKWTLKKQDLAKTSLLFAFITDSRGKPMEQALGRYAFGLALAAKNDFHLRTESEAFIAFYLSFKEAMKISGDWNGESDLVESAKKIFSKLNDFKGLEQTIALGEKLIDSKKEQKVEAITLTEVFGMKLYADIYFEMLANKMPTNK